MTMSWFESVLFGFISGLTEFFPVSAQAHQTLLLTLFGSKAGSVLTLMIHIAVLLSAYQNCREYSGLWDFPEAAESVSRI